MQIQSISCCCHRRVRLGLRLSFRPTNPSSWQSALTSPSTGPSNTLKHTITTCMYVSMLVCSSILYARLISRNSVASGLIAGAGLLGIVNAVFSVSECAYHTVPPYHTKPYPGNESPDGGSKRGVVRGVRMNQNADTVHASFRTRVHTKCSGRGPRARARTRRCR